MKKRLTGIFFCICLTVNLFSTAGYAKDTKKDFAAMRGRALIEVNKIKTSDYIKEDKNKVIKLRKQYLLKINKVKDKKNLEKTIKDLNKDFSKIPERKVIEKRLKIELKKSSKKLKGKKRHNAYSIINKYKLKNKLKSKKHIVRYTKKIIKTIEKKTRSDIKYVSCKSVYKKAKKDAAKKSNRVLDIKNITDEKVDKNPEPDKKPKPPIPVDPLPVDPIIPDPGEPDAPIKVWIPEHIEIIEHPAITREREFVDYLVCQCGETFKTPRAWQEHRPQP